MQKKLIGSLVGGAVAWLVALVVFALIKPLLIPAPTSHPPELAKMIEIYAVFVISLFLAAQALGKVSGGAQRQTILMFWAVIGVEVFTRIGKAVEMPDKYPMGEALFATLGETLCLVAGGYVIARWFLNLRATANTTAAD